MRILIVKLSSLGDVVHALPVVHDIHAVCPGAVVDWVVEPAFAPLVRRTPGVDRVIACALRRWSGSWWRAATRRGWRAFRAELGATPYDRVIDLQGLTKSAVVARLATLAPGGLRFGLANRTEGASHEPPARWLVDRAVRIRPHVHALDRSRVLVAAAFGMRVFGPPVFGMDGGVGGGAGAREGVGAGVGDRAGTGTSAVASLAPRHRTLVLIHGTSRADKLWPEDHWIDLGRRAIAAGWHVALPQAGADEATRAVRIATALRAGGVGSAVAEVWPAGGLEAVVDRLAAADGAIGVDSGLSHIAVALGLPHVQVYNWPTAWRTGPLPAHGHRRQRAVEGSRPAGSDPKAPAIPSVDAVWAIWEQVTSGRFEAEAGEAALAGPDTGAGSGAQAASDTLAGSGGPKTAARIGSAASPRR